MESRGGGLSEKDSDKYEQSIRIRNKDHNSSLPIVDRRSSLLNVLARYALYSIRVYVIPPDDSDKHLAEMRRRIKADLPEIDWK
jgi:hypothetical protein